MNRKELFTQAIGMKLLVDTAAAVIQNPTEQMTWKEVEDTKVELQKIGKKLAWYIEAVEANLLDNTPIWAEQWDKAQELVAPWNDPDDKYNPDDIVIADLAATFVKEGLCQELADVVATSIKYPQLG